MLWNFSEVGFIFAGICGFVEFLLKYLYLFPLQISFSMKNTSFPQFNHIRDSPKKQKQNESHKEKFQFKIPEQKQVFLR